MIDLDPRAQEHEIKAHALWAVGQVKTYLSGLDRAQPVATPGVTAEGMKTLSWATQAATPSTAAEVEHRLNAIAAAYQARPANEKISLSGRIARMMDAGWWTRNLRRETVKRNEAIEHEAGKIRRSGEVYASNHAVKVKAVRAAANRKTLEGLEVVNEAGQAFNLQDVADKSISNPKIRRGELMMRARGFEEAAELHGHVALFLTITCPSRFHRFNAAGLPNSKWQGTTPRDAQDYLCTVWADIRSAWDRKGITPYGFRVAEPNHEGCPHWHILLFMPAEHAGWFEAVDFCGAMQVNGAGAVGIAAARALSDSGNERGAAEHRFTVEKIDTLKGSATGYIAKYISKNIDGMKEDGDAMGLDFASGTPAEQAAIRVKTWASTWHIRQFQQVGGPSVTVWRELRRLGEVAKAPTDYQADLFAGPQDAADNAMWCVFWMLQGGPSVRRKFLTLKPAYTTEGTGKYGDEISRVSGVTASKFGMRGDTSGKKFKLVCELFSQSYLKTRLHTWTVQHAGAADANAGQAEHRAELASAAAVQRFLTSVIRNSNGVSEARAAWTGVNNCTVPPVDTTANPFDFSRFDSAPGDILYLPEYARAGEPWDVAEAVDTAEAAEAAAPRMPGFEVAAVPFIQPIFKRNDYESIRG